MKFNILFLLFPLALAACIWIALDFQGQSSNSFFGIAETEPQTLNFDRDIAVRELNVKIGDRVKKGDTLAIFASANLEKIQTEQLSKIALTEAEQLGNFSIIEKEKSLLTAQLAAKIRERTAQIRLIQIDDSLKTAYRKNLYNDLDTAVENKFSAEKIASLKKEIADAATQTQEQLRLLETKQTALKNIAIARTGQSQVEINFVSAERGRLFLISPIDGYVESIFFGKNALVPAHRDLMRINALTPNRVIGFIHEASDVSFSIGQTVEMVSFTRPKIRVQGTIIGSNPKMTELPLRLRKFVEMRSWGREVYIQLPTENDFYIAEKITITLPVQ